MHASQSMNFNGHSDSGMKKNNNGVSNAINALMKGLRAAAVAKTCPNDKEAMLRMLSEK